MIGRHTFFHTSSGDPVTQRILSFRALETGWNFGRGAPPSQDALRNSIVVALHMKSLGAHSVEAFPCSNGAIVVAGHHGDTTANVTCHPESRFDLLIEQVDEEVVDAEGVGIPYVFAKMAELGWKATSSSDFFIRNTMIGQKVGLTASPRVSQTMASLSSTNSARLESAEHNAHMFHYTTPREYQAHRQFSYA